MPFHIFRSNWYPHDESEWADARNRISGKRNDVITVDMVDMHIEQNATDHHTSEYDLVDSPNPIPILRRGQPFYMSIKFRRPLDFQKDRVKLEFSFGSKRSPPASSTYKVLDISTKNDFGKTKDNWDVRLHEHNGDTIDIYVNVPATVSVGMWTLKVISDSGSPFEKQMYEYDKEIYILFNPWCKEDAVYMDDERKREAYVLNDFGKIYNMDNISGRLTSMPWAYAQFSTDVFNACMMILEKSRLKYTARANPINVVRTVSAMVNTNDDYGVLVGKWKGDFSDGVSPQSWGGSEAILKEYLETKGRPVRYGQCWVFAGVTTTICRALGIPTRTVTNYSSAHDTDKTLTIDRFYDENGRIKPDRTDTIWNFHVWNECWMARPDLPPGYGGWQVIDATPQEPSQGMYRTGPASVTAIRRGEIGYEYDAAFVFAEVNADVVEWEAKKVENRIERIRVISRRTEWTGRLILTQKVGVYFHDKSLNDAEDITGEYKYLEGTPEERMAIKNAARHIGKESYFDMPQPSEDDVIFELKDIEQVLIGRPFEVTIHVENKSKELRNVRIMVSVDSVYYTGVYAQNVKKEHKEIALKPNQNEAISVTVDPQEYMNKLVEQCNMKIFAMGRVTESNQIWCAEDDFIMGKPEMKLQTKGPIKVGTAFDLSISFTNPLDIMLEDCFLVIECPGLIEPLKKKMRSVKPKETITYTEQLTPRKAGTKNISVTFNCSQLLNLRESAPIQVLP